MQCISAFICIKASAREIYTVFCSSLRSTQQTLGFPGKNLMFSRKYLQTSWLSFFAKNCSKTKKIKKNKKKYLIMCKWNIKISFVFLNSNPSMFGKFVLLNYRFSNSLFKNVISVQNFAKSVLILTSKNYPATY